MNALTEHIERLERNSLRISSAASSSYASASTGPFTRAILDTDLGDLIRDVDPSELGLFSLVVPPSQDREQPESSGLEIARVPFTGATPLKRRPTGKQKEDPPEVYARAALRCIDRYESIRPMPRASSQVEVILEQMQIVRDSIDALSEELEQTDSVEIPSVKTTADDEARRVSELQAKVQELQARKELAMKRKKKLPITRPKPKPKPPSPSPPPVERTETDEDQFWSNKTFHLEDDGGLLVDEDVVQIGNISMDSLNNSFTEAPTVISPTDPDTSSDTPSRSPTPTPQPPTTVQTPAKQEAPKVTSNATPQAKLKVTVDMERIVAKLWSSMGDVIMPGHTFDVTGSSSTKPPKAKETFAYLQSVASLNPTPTPNSPTYASSISSLGGNSKSSTPTAQQILTAHLLVSLLSEPPSFSMPLNSLKTSLGEKASQNPNLVGAQGTTRIIYACVAKRVVKIDRGRGEQVVMFDI